jgi:hypothetical protein
MDYYKFLDEYQSYNEWNQLQKKAEESWDDFKENEHPYVEKKPFHFETKYPTKDRWLKISDSKDDRVNSPSHYTSGKLEVIDIIEDVIKDAPTNSYGMLQAQVLKYLLRMWLKDNPLEDMKKARWYLDRLISQYSNPNSGSTTFKQ